MKKFLCYDTNDAASGKINVDSRGMLKPNSTVPSGSTPYHQLVTDGDGSTQWEDRLAYEDVRIISELIDINWDGNTEGLVASSRNNYYKVSDYVFTLDQFKQMNYVYNSQDISVASQAEQGGINSSSGIIAIRDGGSAPVIVSQEAVVSGASVSGGAPDSFPEPGVYFPANVYYPITIEVTRLYSVEPITISKTEIKQIDEKFLPDSVVKQTDLEDLDSSLNIKLENLDSRLNVKMDKNNPVGTGSFSMNRKSDTEVGYCSHAEGNGCEASGGSSHAEGYWATASGSSSHAEGYKTTASGKNSHSEGINTVASGETCHAEGDGTTATGTTSHAEGKGTTASSVADHAEGAYTEAKGGHSHAEGYRTIASGAESHVQGKFNIEDTTDKYAHIVGNGSSSNARSNAHTLDWSGNAWYAGTVEGTAMIVKSSTEGSSKRFKITVDDSGTISATEVTT